MSGYGYMKAMMMVMAEIVIAVVMTVMSDGGDDGYVTMPHPSSSSTYR